MSRTEIMAAMDEYAPRRRARNRVAVTMMTVWVQFWFHQWWFSLLMAIVLGAFVEWAWRPGGWSYEHKLDRWLERPSLVAKERGR